MECQKHFISGYIWGVWQWELDEMAQNYVCCCVNGCTMATGRSVQPTTEKKCPWPGKRKAIHRVRVFTQTHRIAPLTASATIDRLYNWQTHFSVSVVQCAYNQIDEILKDHTVTTCFGPTSFTIDRIIFGVTAKWSKLNGVDAILNYYDRNQMAV